MENNTSTPDSSNSNQSNENITETPVAGTGPSPGAASQPSHSPDKKSRFNKKMAAIIATIVVLAAGAAAAYWVTNNNKETTQPNNNATNTEAADEQPEVAPEYALLYTKTDEVQTDDCLVTNEKLFRMPFGKESQALENIDSRMISHTDSKGANIVFSQEASCGDQDGPAIYYSGDGGQTFEKVFSSSAQDGNEALGDQITSLKLSKDGESVVFGFLSSNAGNVVKKVDLKSKDVSDIYQTDRRGVFIYGYDSEKDMLYFNEGCYNCDGSFANQLISYDINAKKSTTVYSLEENKLGDGLVMNHELTKFLVSNGVSGDGLGAAPPYELREVSISDGSEKMLLSDQSTYFSPGYRIGDDMPYVVQGEKILGFSGNDPIALFESERNITNDLYVGDDRVVVLSDNDESGAVVIDYNPATNEAKRLIEFKDFSSPVAVLRIN